MKNDKWELVLEQVDGDVIIDNYPNKKLAEQERDTTIKKLREELGRSGKTKWVEDHD